MARRNTKRSNAALKMPAIAQRGMKTHFDSVKVRLREETDEIRAEAKAQRAGAAARTARRKQVLALLGTSQRELNQAYDESIRTSEQAMRPLEDAAQRAVSKTAKTRRKDMERAAARLRKQINPLED